MKLYFNLKKGEVVGALPEDYPGTMMYHTSTGTRVPGTSTCFKMYMMYVLYLVCLYWCTSTDSNNIRATVKK